MRIVDVLLLADGRKIKDLAESCRGHLGGEGMVAEVISAYLTTTAKPRPIPRRHLEILAEELGSKADKLFHWVDDKKVIGAALEQSKPADEYQAPTEPPTKPEVKDDSPIVHLRAIARPLKPLLPANFDFNMGTAPVFLAAAGRPLLVGEAVDKAPVPTKFMSKVDENNFYVLVRGYSMIHSQIDDGDLVFCRKDKVPKTGNIVAATVDGDGVLKILEIRKDGSRWLLSDTDLLEDYSEYEVKDGVEIHAVAIFVLKSLEKRTKLRV